MINTPDRTAIYEHYRSHLFGVAYRMLGTVSDAEDIVQEAFLRWQDAPDDIDSPKAYLTTIVSRLALDTLRAARTTRETYIGPWLPEPLLTEPEADAAAMVDLNESLSLAFLTLLERLNPVERAAFLLHDVFGYGFEEIATIVERSPAACRKAAQRARERIRDDRPRFEPTPSEQDRLTNQFIAACITGDVPGLVAILTEDVTVWGDGGGVVAAARQPMSGASRVAHFLTGLRAHPGRRHDPRRTCERRPSRDRPRRRPSDRRNGAGDQRGPHPTHPQCRQPGEAARCRARTRRKYQYPGLTEERKVELCHASNHSPDHASL